MQTGQEWGGGQEVKGTDEQLEEAMTECCSFTMQPATQSPPQAQRKNNIMNDCRMWTVLHLVNKRLTEGLI